MILYARPNELQSAGIGKSFACPVGTVHPWLSRCQTALPRNWEAPLVHDNLGIGKLPNRIPSPKTFEYQIPPLRAPKMSTVPNQWDSCRDYDTIIHHETAKEQTYKPHVFEM